MFFLLLFLKPLKIEGFLLLLPLHPVLALWEASDCIGREIGSAHTRGPSEECTRQVALLKRIEVGLRTFGKRKAGTF